MGSKHPERMLYHFEWYEVLVSTFLSLSTPSLHACVQLCCKLNIQIQGRLDDYVHLTDWSAKLLVSEPWTIYNCIALKDGWSYRTSLALFCVHAKHRFRFTQF